MILVSIDAPRRSYADDPLTLSTSPGRRGRHCEIVTKLCRRTPATRPKERETTFRAMAMARGGRPRLLLEPETGLACRQPRKSLRSAASTTNRSVASGSSGGFPARRCRSTRDNAGRDQPGPSRPNCSARSNRGQCRSNVNGDDANVGGPAGGTCRFPRTDFAIRCVVRAGSRGASACRSFIALRGPQAHPTPPQSGAAPPDFRCGGFCPRSGGHPERSDRRHRSW